LNPSLQQVDMIVCLYVCDVCEVGGIERTGEERGAQVNGGQ